MTAREWMNDGTTAFLAQIDQLTDEQFGEPSALAGWTRAHVIAHLHGNAEALRRLVGWAATGVARRMYADAGQRAAEIESGARLPAAELRSLVRDSAEALAADLDALSGDARRRTVVTAQGRTMPATELPWLRARETWVHAVDLRTGLTFTDLPEDFLTALAADALRKHAASGQAAGLAAWLTGRADAAPEPAPWL